MQSLASCVRGEIVCGRGVIVDVIVDGKGKYEEMSESNRVQAQLVEDGMG